MADIELIDSHCHLCHGRLRADLPGVLDRAAAAGVMAIICASGSLQEAAAAEKLASQHVGRATVVAREKIVAQRVARPTLSASTIYFTAGVHPHEAKSAEAGYLDRLAELAADGKCVAIGEIGLDYHYNFSEPDVQRKAFAEQLALAVRLARPVVIHTREAFDDTLAIIRDSGLDGRRIVFHSFTEPPDAAGRVLEIGASISFSGIVTFRNSDQLRQSALLTPDDRLMIETDSPYLSPEPVRRMKTNEPANVAHVAVCLAKLRNCPFEHFARLTAENTKRLFSM
ncbi:MAG: TatD family hydrolase [Planctomycetes bacterium]|nr:TatD family hydrolase [Planctomycetota bacterium]